MDALTTRPTRGSYLDDLVLRCPPSVGAGEIGGVWEEGVRFDPGSSHASDLEQLPIMLMVTDTLSDTLYFMRLVRLIDPCQFTMTE